MVWFFLLFKDIPFSLHSSFHHGQNTRAHALLGRFQDIVIRSIEPIDRATLTKEEWDQIRGPNALVGNADVYSAWLVTWTPTRYANAPYPWQVMVVKSISPLTGEPAFMTVPARGKVPTYFER